MPTTRVAACRTSNFAKEVTGKGFQTFDGWEVVLTVPKEELVAGASYAVVITGTCGAFWHQVASQQWKRAEITARTGASNYIATNLVHTQYGPNTQWHAVYDPGKARFVSGLRGLPFQIIYRFTMPNPVEDFHVVARMAVSSSTAPGGKFLIENLTALLWDLTTIAATSGIDAYSFPYVGSNFRIPYASQPLVRPILGAVGSAGTYLVYHSAFLTGTNPVSNDRIGLDNTATQKFNRPIGNTQLGSSNPLDTAVWLGQQGVRDLALAEQLSQWTHALYNSPATQGWYHHGEILAIRLHGDQQLFREPTGPSALIDFFANQYQGTPIGPVQHGISYGADYFLWGHANLTFRGGAAALLLEMNGGEFRPLQVHGVAGGGPVQSIASVRCEAPVVHAGQHKFRMWGEGYHEDTAFWTSKQIGRDAQIYGFGLLVGYIPPADVLETKGPILVVVPGRETGLAVGSLPLLPTDPSYAYSVDVQNELRELAIPRGDQIVSPKFLKGRRIFRFVWSGISKADGEALVTFYLDLRDTSGGCFRWRPPQEFADVALTLDAPTFSAVPGQDLETYEVSFDAIELVFVVP